MTHTEIEQRILELLSAGPMTQAAITDAFPLDHYIDVGKVVRDLDRRGVVARERCGTTRMVTLVES